MSEANSYRLGDLQLRIMSSPLAVWAVGVARSSGEARGDVWPTPPWPPCCGRWRIAGWSPTRRRTGDSSTVRPSTSRTSPASMADDLVDRLFEGSLAETVSHLLQTREVDENELTQLETVIRKRKYHNGKK